MMSPIAARSNGRPECSGATATQAAEPIAAAPPASAASLGISRLPRAECDLAVGDLAREDEIVRDDERRAARGFAA